MTALNFSVCLSGRNIIIGAGYKLNDDGYKAFIASGQSGERFKNRSLVSELNKLLGLDDDFSGTITLGEFESADEFASKLEKLFEADESTQDEASKGKVFKSISVALNARNNRP